MPPGAAGEQGQGEGAGGAAEAVGVLESELAPATPGRAPRTSDTETRGLRVKLARERYRDTPGR